MGLRAIVGLESTIIQGKLDCDESGKKSMSFNVRVGTTRIAIITLC